MEKIHLDNTPTELGFFLSKCDSWLCWDFVGGDHNIVERLGAEYFCTFSPPAFPYSSAMRIGDAPGKDLLQNVSALTILSLTLFKYSPPGASRPRSESVAHVCGNCVSVACRTLVRCLGVC